MQVANGTVVNGRIIVEGFLTEGEVVAAVSSRVGGNFSLPESQEDDFVSVMAKIERLSFSL